MDNPCPSWSRYMTDVSKGEYPRKSSVSLLPIIDLNPTDVTCIFCTLKFVEHQAKELEIMTAVIIFDQPLWIKGFEIIEAKSLNIVCMLGGFLLMNFLRSIGAVMKGSSLEEAMEQVYAENSHNLPHIISGKAVSRALRAHFLVESALVNRLMAPLIDRIGTDEEDDEANVEVDQYKEYILEDSEQYGTVLIVDLKAELKSFSKGLDEDVVFDIELYPTIAKLQDFNLYLTTLGRTINLFATTAHINYAKSARLYLQQMLALYHLHHPWVYTQFAEGRLHTIRRNDRYWVGLWGDLIIEQVMI